MRILHVTAQKPSSTGSGIYLMKLGSGIASCRGDCAQAVLAGIYEEDLASCSADLHSFAERFYPVCFNTGELPFPIPGMSDVMPYESTMYRSMTDDQVRAYCRVFKDKARHAVQDFRPDVILCHHLYLLTSLIRSEFPDIPVCGFCHNTDLIQFSSHDLAHDLIKRSIPELDHIFALHEEQKEHITSLFHVKPEIIKVIGAGYDPSVFNAKSHTASEGRPLRRLIFAGKLSFAKGVASLLHALSEAAERDGFPDEVSLTLAGGAGDQKEYEIIRDLAARCRVPAAFTGKISQRQLADYYRQSDLFVLPSFSEGLPLSVIEALACGLDVMMTDLPGVYKWLSDHVDNPPVRLIAPPSDSADPGSVRAFEMCLADALYEALTGGVKTDGAPDLSDLCWDALAARVLKVL